jgi:hypothetical protein
MTSPFEKSGLASGMLITSIGLVSFWLAMAAWSAGVLFFEMSIASRVGPVSLWVSVIIPLSIPWIAIYWSKRKIKFALSHPENAAGGMTLGLALIWGCYLRYTYGETGNSGPFIWAFARASVPAVLAMAFGGLAASFIRRNINFPLLVISPFLALASLALLSGLLLP